MRIESLRYLVDFSEIGSVSATAAKNYMSEQGMSRIFRQLEKELGVVLFVREGKSVRLSDAGMELAACARSVVAEYRVLEDKMGYYAEQDRLGEGEGTVLCTPLVAMCFISLLDLLKPGLLPFPIVLAEKNLDEFFDDDRVILDGRGIGIATLPPVGVSDRVSETLGDERFTFIPLFDSEVVALISAASPLSHLKALPKELYVSRTPGGIGVACLNDDAAMRQLESTVCAENVRITTSNVQLIKRYVRSGSVCIFLPKIVLVDGGLGKGITWLPLKREDGDLQYVRFGIVVSTKHLTSAQESRASLLVDYVRRSIGSLVSSQKLSNFVKMLIAE